MKEASAAISAFAAAFERLNEFARFLRDQRRFSNARSDADIRNFEVGWRLEKWVEAELNPAAGEWATWWIEVGHREEGLIISSSLSISHNDFYINLPDRIATSTEELERCLTEAVDELMGALEKSPDFARAVEASLGRRNDGA